MEKLDTLQKFEDLKGRTLLAVENIGNERLVFTLDNGEKYMLWHNQDCCESVTIEDVVGELSDLTGVPIRMAEEVTNERTSDEYGDGETWTFYKLATIKGYVTIRWRGRSNGYYSESVDWAKVE